MENTKDDMKALITEAFKKDPSLVLLAGLLGAMIEENDKLEAAKKEGETPTSVQVEKINALTAELLKKDKSIEHWKRVVAGQKERIEGLINEKSVLEEKLRKFNAGEDEQTERIAKLEADNASLREAIANTQIELARARSNVKTPSPWYEYKKETSVPDYWLNQPTAEGTN